MHYLRLSLKGSFIDIEIIYIKFFTIMQIELCNSAFVVSLTTF